jgi:alpha-L-fucosidase
MTVSRRRTVQGGLLVASEAMMGNPLRAWAQLQGSNNPTAAHPVRSIQDTETPAQNSARMKWYREARFGMFIHWGLYAIPAGRWEGHSVPGSEWIMNAATIPVAEYKALASKFNPTQFNAAQIVSLAKAAGMKYIVITSKHHDGFAMFDSKADPFNIVQATPFKRDPLKELAVECRKQGMKLGFYYSQVQDWTAPGGVTFPPHGAGTLKSEQHKPPTYHWDRAQDGNFPDYLHRKAIPQIREMLANYGESPDILWFGSPDENMTPELAGEIVTILNEHPKLIWSNRLGGGYKGDMETPEQSIPAHGPPGRDWELCMSMNDAWGYKEGETNFKSTETLLRNLIDIASKGGNYLLNIGPTATGEVPAPEAERLQQMGKWLAVNGDSIYATGPTLFGAEAGAFSTTQKDESGNPKFVPSWTWRSTTAPDKIYVHLFEWPGATFHLGKAPRAVTGADMLADKARTPLKVTMRGGGVEVELPKSAPDPIATVLVLRTA